MNLSNGARRRQALAGIVSAVIFFAVFLSVGTGFFLAVNQLRNNASDASLSRLSQQAQANAENLSLGVAFSSFTGDLFLSINNTGGVPSTIESIFVTNTAGAFVSFSTTSPGSAFLTGEDDLSINLPLTLSEGATTSSMPATAGGIEIVSATLPPPPAVVFVNVLTKLGNVFSAAYPPLSQLTYKNKVVSNGAVEQVNDGGVVDQTNLNEVIGGCVGCASGIYVGGEILILQIIASPSPVANDGDIGVTATVTDYSAYPATDVSVSLNSLDAGTASVNPASQQCGETEYIPSLESGTFSCTFEALAGTSGGSVVFDGTASACILTPSTTSPCSSGTPASSSLTGSNPVQVGPSVSYGVWQMNYYFFGYTSAQTATVASPSCYPKLSGGCEPVSVISGSDTYVTLYISVTNTGSEPLTLLDETFMQSSNPGSASFNLFIVDGVNYPTSGAPTITPYECVDAPPAPPYSLNGGPCVTVPAGGTITIEFASEGPGSGSQGTTWDWGGDGLSAATQGGNTIATLIQYAAEGTGGVYTSASSNIPFMQVYVS